MAIRSTFAGLNTMYSGISTNRIALETTGHNMTNANVAGYSRQRVNQSAMSPDKIYGSGNMQFVGRGVDSYSITRARDVFADKQYWRDYSEQTYFSTRVTNYQKLEAIFNDAADTGIADAMQDFYKAWVDLNSNASSTSHRTAVIERGQILSDRVNTAAKQLQHQITSQYDDIMANVGKVNIALDQMVELNKSIANAESVGASANDLRDQRDSLVDELSGFMSISITEDMNSMYTVVSNGITLVNGVSKMNLTIGPISDDGAVGIPNAKYGLTDYRIEIDRTGVVFDPLTGSLKAELDSIQEDKEYIDKLANIAAFLLTDFNAQHKVGAGMDVLTPYYTSDTNNAFPTTGINFFGSNNMDVEDGTSGVAYIWNNTEQRIEMYSQTVSEKYDEEKASWSITVTTLEEYTGTIEGISLINALAVATDLTAIDGERKVAARSIYTSFDEEDSAIKSLSELLDIYRKTGPHDPFYADSPLNGTADGSNAVLLSTLMNLEDNTRSVNGPIGVSSVIGYYSQSMTVLGVDAESYQVKLHAQEDLVTQVMEWRTSTDGVNWDEELTNMIMFQQGYVACSRCLNAMDEMLDRLVNSTGVVGR